MPFYVIAQRGDEFLDMPVFHAGPQDGEEAIAVFTDLLAAQAYIDEADWSSDHEVGGLDEGQLLRLMCKAHGQGTQFLAINPKRQSQMAGKQQEVIVIEEKIATLAEILTRDLVQLAQQATTS